MANRCPECNRFVTVEMGEPEVDAGDLEEGDGKKGTLNLTIKLSRVCAECGTELTTKEIETQITVDLADFEDAV